ncbi:hypothetical protein Q664_01420 [Archangium violaceum Cb vi76]|uniref:Uncharacterized protein n=1 Tax=Archangium violaceum Cb vi76 TaxID=1406225 RepID=A0A084T1X9_9BACT|nr:hypothetical protein Q664_01420 [Archangium violaceum Cb vi76]
MSGVLPTEISFDGSQSRDPDNQDSYDPYYPMNWYPGMGITGYAWQAIPPTPQCNGPTLPASEKFVLYPAGATIPPSCQGRWRMRLTVSDDDRVTKTSTQEYTFAIGNCSGKLCLDSPRQLAPAILSTEGTGGTFIGYHIDSAMYDETSFGLGVYTKLEIFIEDNTLNPIYSAVSGPATQTSRGQPIPLYWNGVTQSGTRVPEGKYFHVKISLLDANANVLGTQIEYRAITSEPMRAVFNEPSTKYVHSIGSGSISFTVTGVQNPVDSYRGILRDSAGNAVATFTAPASAIAMSINYSTPGFYSFELFAIRGTSAISLGTHPLTIYKLLLWSGVNSVNALDLEMLVNSDDDNLNGLPDMQEAFGVDTLTYGDDEVRVFRAYFQPRELAGTLTLEHTLGVGALKAWTTPTKAAEVTLPKAWIFPGTAADSPILSDYGYELYLEAHKEAKGEVRLVFTTMDGISLPKAGIPLSTVVLDAVGDTDNDHVIEDEDAVLRTLRPGRWDNAYDGAFNVRNNMDPDHFVDLDPSRFYLRAKGPKLDVDPSKADILQFFLTISHQVNYDTANIMRLPESGPNTAMMVSRSLMLTGTDIEGISRTDTDDGFPVHDGISKVVSDGAIGDRTWRAPIDAHLTVWYNQPNAATLQWRLPVCGAERRKLPLRIHVFLEPYQDVGFDDDGNPATPNVGALNARFDYADVNGNGQHDLGERSEPYVNLSDPMTDMVARSGDDPAVLDARGPLMPINDVWRELRHTDSLWSPACIKIEVVGGTILVEDAPSYNFHNILADGVMTEPEISQLYRVYNASMTEDVIDVFYGTTQNLGIAAAGLAFPPLYQTPAVPHGEKLFTIIKSGMPSYATLAHELAHLLTNTGDSAGNQTFFYPLNVPLTPLTTVNGGRRMPGWVATDARTVRPAGNLAARGNRQLKSY